VQAAAGLSEGPPCSPVWSHALQGFLRVRLLGGDVDIGRFLGSEAVPLPGSAAGHSKEAPSSDQPPRS
jgi:hypothetical protein